MYTVKVLDKGFVTLRNVAGPTRRTGIEMGGDEILPESVLRDFDADDRDPAQAARLSFEQGEFGEEKGERTLEEDMKLTRYLLLNEHTSPFEMIQVWIEVKVPIFVDRQMVRHRTWSRNESSARYITLPNEWYIPETVGGKSPTKKQGRSENLDPEIQDLFKTRLNNQCADSYRQYEQFLELGVAPEHARMFLHLNHYVHWIGSVNLHNLFRFLRLRLHSHTQYEARIYAGAIVELLRPHLPNIMKLFDEVGRKPE